MATTNLIPLHTLKGYTPAKSVGKVIKYVENPQKTENGNLVTGFACTPALADQEFALMKSQYISRTGRKRGRDDVIAYHLRQSFVPGEITPEEANRLGRELAIRFTHGSHAFIVATHTDRHHIHNHIIFSAVNLDCDRKFRNFWGSSKALRRLNDVICIENGYSVIEQPQKHTRQKYNKWMETNDIRKQPSQRDHLRQAIDHAMAQNPKDLPELLAILSRDGWEIRHGKHIAVRGKDEQRSKRLDSLGEGYTQADLIARLAANETNRTRSAPQTGKRKNPITAQQEQKVSLLIDIQSKMRAAKGQGYELWAKKFNLKEMAKTFSYLKEHNLLDRQELDRRAADACGRTDTALKRIREIEKRQKEIRNLRTRIIQYSKTREIYVQYKQSNWSRKFAAQHEQEIMAHKAAKAAFDALKIKRIPKIRELKEEYDHLQAEKEALERQYRDDRQEMRQLLIVQENVHRILDTEPNHPKSQQRKQTR